MRPHAWTTPPSPEVIARRVSHAIDRAAHYLAVHQLSSGEIPVNLGFHRDLHDAQHDPCVFGSALAALSLHGMDHPLCRLVVARANRHIASQRRADNTWTYWPKTLNVASDADDTACCSMALIQSRQVTASAMRSNAAIFEAHRDTCGLFQTWFQHGWNIIDSVVNANVLAYLGSRPGTTAAAEYLVELIRTNREHGTYPYYADPASLYYAIARAMRFTKELQACRPILIEKLRASLSAVTSGQWIFLAQSLSALSLLGTSPLPEFRPALNHLLAGQQPDGNWPADAFYTGPPGVPLTNWYGSPEASTTLCLEALGHSAFNCA